MTPGPKPFVVEMAQGLTPGRALDLACGDGRNAIWLADRGWQVTGVDRAPTVIHPGVNVVTADLEKHEFAIDEASWDLIVVSYYLQTDLFPHIVRGLKAGGVAIIIVLLFEPEHAASRFSLRPGELRRHFEGHTILAYFEGKPAPEARAVAQIAIRA
ncbi:MAG: methyltransferase domain-containing protein [Bryobacteraceae bacterium]